MIGLEDDFELVDVPLPTGQVVKCARQESVLIPVAKVTIYGMGKSPFTTEEAVELDQLKQERRAEQRAFSRSSKSDRLRELQRKQDNQRKLLENLEALWRVGMSDSTADVRKIISHLLKFGATVTASTMGGEMARSQLDAPQGPLTVQTGWKVLEDGRRYMTTIHFLPPSRED